jgi:hypothetical protein
MAKGNRTTSTARRATAAKATLSLSQVSESLCRLEDEASVEVFGLEHLSVLMELMGDCVGTPGAGWDNMEMQKIGLRIEYLGELVKRHAEPIGRTLIDIRTTAERMQRGGAQ